MKKNSTTELVIAVLCTLVVGSGYYFILLDRQSKNIPPDAPVDAAVIADTLFGWQLPSGVRFPSAGLAGGPIAYSNIRQPGGVPQGLPVRLQIPVIAVDSAIEDALITPDGRMDIPAGTENVAWFALGPHPGDVGSAVIGGHFGISNGVKFVFYDLDKLVVGDKVYVVNDEGETLAFQVKRIQLFDRNADATTVFTSYDGKAHLNLITCEGIWNQVNGTYPLRRVVFTDKIASEGPVTVPPRITIVRTVTPTPVPPAQAAPIKSAPTKTKPKVTISTPKPTLPSSGTEMIATSSTSLVSNADKLVTFILFVSIIFVAGKIIML